LKKLFLLLFFIILPALAHAQDSGISPPHWSFEVKGGIFEPALSNWSQYYSERYMPEFAMSLAYKIVRQVEIGFEGGYLTAHGTAVAPLHGIAAGSVNYNLFPASAFLLFRGVLREEQVIVPYVGGGYTKIFYNEEVQNQATVKGSADGYNLRGGLQFLLDGLDTSAANNLEMNYGINHTYLFVEVQYIHAVTASNNLGGTGYLAGLLFEF
jgi:hypothetical protein